MEKELLKNLIIELFQEGKLNIEIDTRRDWRYENWNDEYNVVTTVKLTSDDDIVISESSDYFTIEKTKEA